MINDILNEADAKMDKSVEATREEFAAIRAGRANPSMFAKILVDYYGTPTPLQQLASFTAPDEGTAMEAWYAHGRGTPVIAYTGGSPVHPWAVYVASTVHARLEDAVAALAAHSDE